MAAARRYTAPQPVSSTATVTEEKPLTRMQRAKLRDAESYGYVDDDDDDDGVRV